MRSLLPAGLVLFFVACFATSTAWAGKFNPTLSIGDAAPEWKELAGTDDRAHSLADLKHRDLIVVVFTCNTCPTALDYEDRIMALAKKLGRQGAVVAINANKVPDDLPPKMKERATSRGFNFAYLHDATQAVAKAYGATWTPEFFVLNKERKVVYMGAMDDSTDPAAVKARYVEDAIDAVRAGLKPATAETPARGCTVRYVRERKKS